MTRQDFFSLATFTAAVGVLSVAVSAADRVLQPARVAVELDVPTSFPVRQLLEMAAETEAIWGVYNLKITWLSRDMARGVGPEDGRIVVKMAPTPPIRRGFPPNAEDRTVVGEITFVDGIPDRVITLYPEAIERAILDVSWNGRPLTSWPIAVREHLAGRATGRALAHELGHYLLAEARHARNGLMRVTFKGNELLDTKRHRFQLQPDNLAALGPRIARLAEAGNR